MSEVPDVFPEELLLENLPQYEIPVPPLKRFTVCGLVETRRSGGEIAYRVTLSEEGVKCGEVTLKLDKQLVRAEHADRKEAARQFKQLAGHAVAQAYVDLMKKGETEAAKSMELDREH